MKALGANAVMMVNGRQWVAGHLAVHQQEEIERGKKTFVWFWNDICNFVSTSHPHMKRFQLQYLCSDNKDFWKYFYLIAANFDNCHNNKSTDVLWNLLFFTETTYW